MSETDQIDKMSEDELRAHVRQLEKAVINLLYIVRCSKEAADGATSRTEISEARQLVGLESQ